MPARRDFVEAKLLTISDQVVGPSGELQTLVQTWYQPRPEGVEVFNFSVADNHSYFVIAPSSTSAPILVHNADYKQDLLDLAERQKQLRRDLKNAQDRLDDLQGSQPANAIEGMGGFDDYKQARIQAIKDSIEYMNGEFKANNERMNVLLEKIGFPRDS